MTGLRKFCTEVLSPLLIRPPQVQVAALCYRERDAAIEVLLITSRRSGRWILPKGWPIDGMNAAEAARQEAWEEAGVRSGALSHRSVGVFDYEKRCAEGYVMPVRTHVYKLRADEVCDDFPEAHERLRRWVSSQEAANLVVEPQLQDILRAV